jgi:hypothetical protein
MPVEASTGPYFLSVPLRVDAVPDEGYQFSGWQGLLTGASPSESLVLTGDGTLTAGFEPTGPTPLPLVINEIHYNPAPDQGDDEDYEFIELYNRGSLPISLEGVGFSDGIEFTFPAGSSIEGGEHILVAVKAETYANQSYQVFEWTDGRLSNGGEKIELSEPAGTIIDEVEYDDGGPWPDMPDGDGPSLSLIDPLLDNELPESWRASPTIGGTPGRRNAQFTLFLPVISTYS